GRLNLVSVSWLRMEILQHVHCPSVTGNLSFDETYRFMSKRFIWHRWREDIPNFIQAYMVCHCDKSNPMGSSFFESTLDNTP
ncbi:hypothetical protein KI387_028356, partial [Taxus chinensis]